MIIKKKVKDNIIGYALITPMVLGFLIFSLIPLIQSIHGSFFDMYDFFWDTSPEYFIGFENYITFWKKDGTNVTIFEYKKERYSIVLTGKILFECVKLDNEILDYIESKDTFENCVKKGIELLENINM